MPLSTNYFLTDKEIKLSYSFSKTGATKAIVLALVKHELENVVAQQPIHSADQAQAMAVAEAFIEIIPDPNENQDVAISLNGSVSWISGGTAQPDVVTGASVGVNAYLVAKKE
jgi:hypothetical protein